MTGTLQVGIIWILVAVIVILLYTTFWISRSRGKTIAKQRVELSERHAMFAGQALELSRTQEDLKRIETEHAQITQEAAETAEEGTKAVLKGAALSLQSLATQQQEPIEGIQHTYGGHPVLSDLMKVNHYNAQMARVAQSIVVICGGFLGRRREPASLYDVVRSAQGQILGFDRVQIMQQSAYALRAPVVSAISLAVAQLLDNAAKFSPGEIEVTFQKTQTALCIVIDDAGVGMGDEERQRAAALLSGEHRPSMAQLGNPPKFGFPVIARLAEQYNFRVDVTGVSRYGGVRAVVALPEELWTEQVTEPAEPQSISAIRGAGRTPRARTPHGLPRRGARVVREEERESLVESSAAASEEGSVGGRGLGAFQRGTLSGRRESAPSSEGSDGR